MSEVTSTTGNATKSATGGSTDALREAGQQLLTLLLQRAAQAATERVGELTGRLTSVAENGGQGLRTALVGRERDEDEDGSGGGLLKRGFSTLTDRVKSAFSALKGGPGGKKKLKVTVISERQDIGLPLRITYDLWTRFSDFPTFMKKVEQVEQVDDTKLNWKAQVFWSHRTWEATIIEQVPDSHIVWRSKAPKGHVDGGVTFTELGPNLTHVALILEYHPQGLFEHTGNLWRAQGRRARLEFQHFRRHAIAHVRANPDEVEGWRGTIHESEVVETHEEALEREQKEMEQAEQKPREDEDLGPEDEYADEESYEEDEAPYDEGEEALNDEPADEELAEDELEDEEPVEEYEQVPARSGRRSSR